MMNEHDILEGVRAISDEFVALFRAVMDSSAGINVKAGKNTLSNSHLYNEIVQIRPRLEGDSFIIEMAVNNYVEWVNTGRKPKARKVPVDALVKWAKDKGLPTTNSFIYGVRENIYKEGIKSRPIIDRLWEEVDRNVDRWSQMIFDFMWDSFTDSK